MDLCGCSRLIQFLLISAIVYTFVSSFEEEPSSLIVSPGTEATFRCRHRTADIIGWLVNGTSVGQIINSDITPGTIRYDGGILVHTLTIVASPEYDNSEVECVASFVHQHLPPQLSPVVTLTVLEGLNETFHDGFISVPTSFNGTERSRIMFTCQHTRTNAIGWLINGTLFIADDYPPNIIATNLNISNEATIHSLLIHPPITNYIIQCAAFIEIQPEKTLPAILLVQGSLQSVTNLARNASTFAWKPPLSLDLTSIDPDIVYCVKVYNITCGRSLLISECDVMETSYTHNALLPGYIFEYSVTPRSNVEGASNGTTDTAIEQFVCLNESAMGWGVSMVDRNLTNVTLNLCVCHESQDAVKPAAYSMIFHSIDGVEDYDGLILPVAAIPSGNDSLVDIVLEVPYRRVLEVTVLAYDCKEHPLTDTIELGTHDIYNISVSSPIHDVVIINGDVIIGSPSRGILAIIYSDFNISYIYVPHNNMQPGVYSINVELPDNQYYVSVFVVEENIQPFLRAAARPKSIFINRSSEVEREPSPIEYMLHSTSTGVCITCTFMDSSSTECVAVVHQQISHLSSSGLINIESSHKFNRYGDTAYGCIEGVQLTAFQIGVIGADLTQGTSSGNSYCISCLIGPIIAPFLCLVLSLIIYIIIIILCKKMLRYKKNSGSRNTMCTEKYKCNYEYGKTEESHSHITEEHSTCLARSVSDVGRVDLDSSWNARTVATLKAGYNKRCFPDPSQGKDQDIPTAKYGEHLSDVHREPDSIFHSAIEERPLENSQIFPYNTSYEENHQMSSTERNESTGNIDIPVTRLTEDEAVSLTDYPIVESESGFIGTSVLILAFQECHIHTAPASIMYSMERLKPVTSSMQDVSMNSLMEDQSSKFTAPQLEMSQLIGDDREVFPVQATDENSADPDFIFLPRHKYNLSREGSCEDQTTHTNQVSGITEAKPERALRSPRRSVFRGQPETATDSNIPSHDALQQF